MFLDGFNVTFIIMLGAGNGVAIATKYRPFRRQAPSRRIALTTHGKDT